MNTEQNTSDMKANVLRAARLRFSNSPGIQLAYEHGQWWATVFPTYGEPDEQIYSVVDASGPGSINGFDFEEV